MNKTLVRTLTLLPMLAACEWIVDGQDFTRVEVPVFQAQQVVEAQPPGDPVQLRVIAWNIKYGAARIPFWFDCWGDRVQMSRAEVDANMVGIYALLDELDADIVMAEEIEVNSRRSAYFDMVQGILDNTTLNYAAYFETWDSRYIASEGLGRMNLGNAIFSKYPISFAEKIRQADRTDQDPLTAAFYIKRAIGRVEIDVSPDTTVAAYVVHTEAYDVDGTKQKQIAQVHEVVGADTLPFVLGGDFNELPPTAVAREDFLDERTTAVCSSDFAQPPYTPEVMQPFYDDFVPSITLERYGTTEEAQKRYFTHSVLGPGDANETGEPGDWNRTLDYLFVSKAGGWVEGSTDVIQRAGQAVGGDPGIGHTMVSDALELSDHAPMLGTWEVRR